jgi:hypothetical protein
MPHHISSFWRPLALELLYLRGNCEALCALMSKRKNDRQIWEDLIVDAVSEIQPCSHRHLCGCVLFIRRAPLGNLIL